MKMSDSYTENQVFTWTIIGVTNRNKKKSFKQIHHYYPRYNDLSENSKVDKSRVHY